MVHRWISALVGWTVSFTFAAGGLLFAEPAPVRAETVGVIYVADLSCCGGTGALIRIDPAAPTGTNQTVVSSGQNFVNPGGVVLRADGLLFVVDQDCCGGMGGVIRVDLSLPAGSNQTIISSGQNFVQPVSLTLAGDGTLYVADSNCCTGINGAVIRVDPDLPNGSNQNIISSGQNFVDPFGLAVAPDGKIYVADFSCCGGGQGGVIRVDPTLPNNSNQTVISAAQHFSDPLGITLAGPNTVYVADFSCCGSAGVIQVDLTAPPGTNQTIVSSGPNLTAATGMTQAVDGALNVMSRNCCGGTGALVRVDPSLPNGSNQTILSSGQSFVDPNGLAVVPGVSVFDTTVTEGTGTTVPFRFSLVMSPPSSQTIVLPFTTANGTATGGGDFTPTSGTVTFSSGAVRGTIELQVIGDSVAEPAETFTATLQPPNGVGTTRATATGNIVDDDGMATLSIADATVLEGNSGTTAATFAVALSPASGQVVTVQYATGAGSAGPTADFQDSTGLLTFQPGETGKSVAVQVVGETAHEPDETFTVALSNPTGGAALGRAQGEGLIRNDDAPDPAAPAAPPAPLVGCTPRPNVRTRPVVSAPGQLQVAVEATPLNTQQNNRLTEVRFGPQQNARVIHNNQPIASGQTITLPPHVVEIDFAVERVTAGQPTMAYFTVVDACGEFPTFVGGGPSAF